MGAARRPHRRDHREQGVTILIGDDVVATLPPLCSDERPNTTDDWAALRGAARRCEPRRRRGEGGDSPDERGSPARTQKSGRSEGAPREGRVAPTEATSAAPRGARALADARVGAAPLHKIGLELLDLLASPAIASRAVVYRTYDQMVGTDTVLGPGADAALLRIKGRKDGIAIAIDAQPRVAALDPFVGAASAVAEALRNIVCVGQPLAITTASISATRSARRVPGSCNAPSRGFQRLARPSTSPWFRGTCPYITRRAARTSGRPPSSARSGTSATSRVTFRSRPAAPATS